MALGSLVDAGADPDEVRALLDRLPVGGWDLRFEPVLRCGIAATQAVVHAPETAVVRTAGHIAGLVEEARLPDRVTRRALATFRALAAPNPLSMPTTVRPAAHEASMASRAVTPSSAAP